MSISDGSVSTDDPMTPSQLDKGDTSPIGDLPISDLDVGMLKLLLSSFDAPVPRPPGLEVSSSSSPVSNEAAPSTIAENGADSPLSDNNSTVLRSDDTTVMLRNVPYEAQQLGVLAMVEEHGFKDTFSFFYCPLDFRSLNNLGYAFIVFHEPAIAKKFEASFDGLKLKNRSGWDKSLKVGRARIQGYQANVDHYRNSPVNTKDDEFKPMLFTKEGKRIAFPAPDTSKVNARAAAITVHPRERRLQTQLKHLSGSKNNRVFVGGLAAETATSTLSEYMSQFGRVIDAQVLLDSTTNRSRSYGFCTFADAASTTRALDAPNHTLHGRNIVVKKYTSNN